MTTRALHNGHVDARQFITYTDGMQGTSMFGHLTSKRVKPVSQALFSPEICLRRVHNEIHNFQKPREALPSQVFQVVAKSNGRAKGWQRAHFASRTITAH